MVAATDQNRRGCGTRAARHRLGGGDSRRTVTTEAPQSRGRLEGRRRGPFVCD